MMNTGSRRSHFAALRAKTNGSVLTPCGRHGKLHNLISSHIFAYTVYLHLTAESSVQETTLELGNTQSNLTSDELRMII